MHQQAHVHVKSVIFTLCLLVLFSSFITTAPQHKGFPLPSWSCSPFPMGWICSGLLTFPLEAAVIAAAGFMVLLTGSFKSALICSSAIGFSSKECCAGVE